MMQRSLALMLIPYILFPPTPEVTVSISFWPIIPMLNFSRTSVCVCACNVCVCVCSYFFFSLIHTLYTLLHTALFSQQHILEITSGQFREICFFLFNGCVVITPWLIICLSTINGQIDCFQLSSAVHCAE